MTLVQPEVVAKWDETHSKGSDKSFPNLDLVRLEKWFFGKRGGKLLEYGFGCGVNLIYLLKCGYQIEAVEASRQARKQVLLKLEKHHPDLLSKVNLHHISVDDSNLRFENGTFDYVTCVSVLSLLGSKERAVLLLREFLRVMKPNAKIILDINGPKSDFARGNKRLGDNVYLYQGIHCYCPENERVFASLVREFFEVDDIGFSAHKYFQSEIQEFIICARKPS